MSFLLYINIVFITVNPQKPTLSLVRVTTPKSTSVMCVIEDFYPKKINVQWKVNNTNSKSPLKLESKLNEDTGHYTAYSLHKVSSKNWDANTLYTCEVTHRGVQIIREKDFNGKSFNVGLLSCLHFHFYFKFTQG